MDYKGTYYRRQAFAGPHWNPRRRRECQRCGWLWTPEHHCPARNACCNRCGMDGHFGRMCHKQRYRYPQRPVSRRSPLQPDHPASASNMSKDQTPKNKVKSVKKQERDSKRLVEFILRKELANQFPFVDQDDCALFRLLKASSSNQQQASREIKHLKDQHLEEVMEIQKELQEAKYRVNDLEGELKRSEEGKQRMCEAWTDETENLIAIMHEKNERIKCMDLAQQEKQEQMTEYMSELVSKMSGFVSIKQSLEDKIDKRDATIRDLEQSLNGRSSRRSRPSPTSRNRHCHKHDKGRHRK